VREQRKKGEEAQERHMLECLRLARRGTGHVSPNPLVGAVLVRGGKIISRGWHKAFGGPHAEVECLNQARGDLGSATLYVNLEPCAHYGKTPPCTDKIIQSGVKSVIVSMKDPNPLVEGRGLRALQEAGIRISTGLLEREARHLNRFFLKHVTHGFPYVNVKIAQSIDGFIAGPRAPRYISSPHSLRLVHRWRGEYDAVLVGAGTVRADNPQLTVRHARGRDPHVVIIDGRFSVPEHANALQRTSGRGVFVCVESSQAKRQRDKVHRLEERGVVVLPLPARRGAIKLRDVLEAIYRFSIGSVLVEGGASVFSQFIDEGLVDELSIFVAPLILGSGVRAFERNWPGESPLGHPAGVSVTKVGRDVLFSSLFSMGRQ